MIVFYRQTLSIGVNFGERMKTSIANSEHALSEGFDNRVLGSTVQCLTSGTKLHCPET